MENLDLTSKEPVQHWKNWVHRLVDTQVKLLPEPISEAELMGLLRQETVMKLTGATTEKHMSSYSTT